jgi:hypothetical protein
MRKADHNIFLGKGANLAFLVLQRCPVLTNQRGQLRCGGRVQHVRRLLQVLPHDALAEFGVQRVDDHVDHA